MTQDNETMDFQQAVEILRSAAGPLMATIGQSKNKKLYDLLMSSLEHALVKYALEMEESLTATAGFLGISRNTLRRKIAKYKLERGAHDLKGDGSAEART